MAALKYWIWLTNLTQNVGAYAGLLLSHFDSPEAIYAAQDEAYDYIPQLSPKVKSALRDKSLLRAEKILEDCDRLGIRMITIRDTEYPERLRQISDPPQLLYIKGKLPQIDDELAIGIVGARKATPYGERAARDFGQKLARSGVLVVSGMAEGIDAAGLTGALLGGGRVISVLGGGIDVIYPRQNAHLYEDVPGAGALISEYPPGSSTDGKNFPHRNRILAGLCLGVLVVEGEERSGSLITARLALEENREVFALPGNYDAAKSRGPHLLIQRGEAKLCCDVKDILEEYLHLYAHKLQQRRALSPQMGTGLGQKTQTGAGEDSDVQDASALQVDAINPKTPQPAPAKMLAFDEPARPLGPQKPCIDLRQTPEALTDDERAILRLLQTKNATPDELIEGTGLPAKRILSALTMLQVAGRVEENPGRRFEASCLLIEENG